MRPDYHLKNGRSRGVSECMSLVENRKLAVKVWFFQYVFCNLAVEESGECVVQKVLRSKLPLYFTAD